MKTTKQEIKDLRNAVRVRDIELTCTQSRISSLSAELEKTKQWMASKNAEVQYEKQKRAEEKEEHARALESLKFELKKADTMLGNALRALFVLSELTGQHLERKE